LEALDAEACLAALESGKTGPPGRLDRSRALRRRALALAREAERADDPAGARAIYRRLIACGAVPAARVAVRIARTLEAEGQSAAALAVVAGARSTAGPVERLALGRAGRRIARALRRGFAPEPPLRAPARRHLRLVRDAPVGPRPGWRAGDAARPVEGAVTHAIAEAWRTALRAEGGLWTTLYALLLADAYF